jgi:DNA-binding transcriptional ArsR family regulator
MPDDMLSQIEEHFHPDDMLSQIEEHFHVLALGEKGLDLGKILSTDTSVKILETVHNSDQLVGLAASDISEAIGVGRTTVIYHLGRMLDSGLVKINPVLQDENTWTKFWNLYRNSTDLSKSRSMVKEVLASIATLSLESDYRRVKKTGSLLGTFGAFLIALSFLFQTPVFLSLANSVGIAQQQPFALEAVDFYQEPPAGLEKDSLSSSPIEEETEDRMGKAAMENKVLDAERSEAYEETNEADAKRVTLESQALTQAGGAQPPISQNEFRSASTVFMYAGILLIGSYLSLLLFSYRRKRQVHG